MDVKKNLQMPGWISGKRYVSRGLIFALALFGLSLIVVAAWLAIADWRMSRAAAAVAEEGSAAVAKLEEPVQALRRILVSEQAQSLANRALENPQTIADLFAYVNGRLSQISAVRVFSGSDLPELMPEDLGPNGYAVFDMLLTALEGTPAPLQIHQAVKPPAMFYAVPINGPGEETVGVMLAAMDPELVLSAFRADNLGLEFVRLSQYNGSQPSSTLLEVGNSDLLGEIPDRMVVPGTLFRLEFPRRDYVGLVSGRWLLLMFLAGVLCQVAVVLLWRGNQKWALQRQIEEAERKQTAPESEPELPQPEPAQRSRPAIADARDKPLGKATEPQPEAAPPPLRLKYNIPEKHRLKESEHTPVELVQDIFRAYDIRGIIDKTLDSGIARRIGQAVGTVALEQDAGPVVVARDGRLSGPYLMEGMIDGIVSTGCDVLDIGAVPTGVLYFAAHEFATGSGVMITGSHNPPDYNGFKVMIAGETLHGEAIMELYQRIMDDRLKHGEGHVSHRNVISSYIGKIAGDIKVERPLRVVIDCGNGIGGVCAADTLRAIGVETLPLFDEVDGNFPNHHPDPSEPENLQDLVESVQLMNADLGLALDGDADRLGVVTRSGNIIYPDRVMMLLARDVLERVPGATIIYDVKCTGQLAEVIREAGGEPVMYKTGHSLIKAKMKETGAPFAGEMSGHFFFGERWYGVDDGIYSAARLLEILGNTDESPEAILNALPSSYSTPELKVQMQEGENHRFIDQFRASAGFDGAEISTIDGLRADFPDGWGLVRASNTTPILVVRFAAQSEEALSRIKDLFRTRMLELRSDLDLPF